MNKAMLMLAATAALWGAVAQADTVADQLDRYYAEGGKVFSAAAGEAMWAREFPDPDGGPARSCSTCHTTDLKQSGTHARTGKAIEPMAPSVNPERLTDAKKIEKWFLRNCKWTLGRECTPQEKGDFLVYIKLQ
ncbi:DUF1924 domain-containing protein [Thioalbus denitrificans]|uniref:Uncharacterized protein DUF1924 n=1 Tax=Thioalbus denitrificans TaxID=547122 RepID=A0A369BVI1_9GAMM|nr:DUF1924 domain-containing protein [Thioalbus denitrificans]RCX24728.1 uncharacterized protein DUF1924 [Thioalbus denitrificans]